MIEKRFSQGGELRLDKSEYSEWVVRHALYWLTAETQWSLDRDETHWIIGIDENAENVRATLDRLLNDYRLREMLAGQVNISTREIADNVLRQIKDKTK